MKKLLLSLLMLITVLSFAGCKNNNAKSDTFKIKNVSLTFNQDSEFHDIKYKNAEGLVPDDSQYTRYLEYSNKDIYDGRFVFRLGLAYNDGTTLDKFIEGHETEKVKINGITWEKAILKSTTDNKEVTAIVYATEKNSTVYAVTTIAFTEANVDIDTLSKVFLNGISLK